jgi:hypothetical protein
MYARLVIAAAVVGANKWAIKKDCKFSRRLRLRQSTRLNSYYLLYLRRENREKIRMRLWIAFVLLTINICITCMSKVKNRFLVIMPLHNFAFYNEQVKMDVYLESLCPDSIRFISQQLYPLYNEFKDNLEITFIPHGKSSVSIVLTQTIKAII